MARKPASKSKAASELAGRAARPMVQALNVNTPGRTYPRDAEKYEVARKVFLKMMPASGAGVTQSEMMAEMKKLLPSSQFGTASGWWTKTVQLDAEARGEVVRDGNKPLRWKKVR